MTLIYTVLENTWLSGMTTGWGNGYVCVPKEHPLYGIDYSDERVYSLDVHGGVTFSEEVTEEDLERLSLPVQTLDMWCFGFDTAHYGDTPVKWTKEAVELETLSLKEQLEELALDKTNP
jgi:hypothetical protein